MEVGIGRWCSLWRGEFLISAVRLTCYFPIYFSVWEDFNITQCVESNHHQSISSTCSTLNVPWSKVAILGMVIPPLIGNPYNGYINPYYWVDDHPLLYGNNGSLDPGTYVKTKKHNSVHHCRSLQYTPTKRPLYNLKALYSPSYIAITLQLTDISSP